MATFADLQGYLRRDGWDEEPNLARGRIHTGDHRRFRKELADGTMLRTKLPHRLRDDIGPDLFRHILRAQLRVTEARFWEVVRGKAPAAAPGPPRAPTIPGWLVRRLIVTVGLDEAVVRAMTPEEAQAAWDAYQVRPE